MAFDSSVEFTGITGIRAVRFPFGRGVTPSSACIYCAPQNLPGGTGDLKLIYNGVTLNFPDMAIAEAHVTIGKGNRHPIMRVYVEDRRWKWRGKIVSGDYNRRLSDGLVDQASAATPADLAAVCLQALGESNYDVSQMPTGVWPRFFKQNDRADLALQELCDYVACEVVLNALTNKVEIWQSGVGGRTPEGGDEVFPKVKFSPRAYVPNRVVVNCGHSIWQDRLLLQACIRDYPSNIQRSMPDTNNWCANGWEYESPFIFIGISDTNKRLRAFEEAWRTYRVIGRADGSLHIGNFPFPINSPNQYVLNDYVLETETDYKGVRHNLPPFCMVGEAWGYVLVAANGTNARSFIPFTLHKDRQIVEYNTPVFKRSSTGTLQPATMYLVTSFRLKTEQGQFGGLYRTATVGGSGGDLVIERPELFSVYSNYPTPGNTEAQTIQEASTYASIFAKKYQNPFSAVITYRGLAFGQLDGYTAQCTWEWRTNAAPTTRVYDGDEYDPLATSPRERRRRLKVEASK